MDLQKTLEEIRDGQKEIFGLLESRLKVETSYKSIKAISDKLSNDLLSTGKVSNDLISTGKVSNDGRIEIALAPLLVDKEFWSRVLTTDQDAEQFSQSFIEWILDSDASGTARFDMKLHEHSIQAGQTIPSTDLNRLRVYIEERRSRIQNFDESRESDWAMGSFAQHYYKPGSQELRGLYYNGSLGWNIEPDGNGLICEIRTFPHDLPFPHDRPQLCLGEAILVFSLSASHTTRFLELHTGNWEPVSHNLFESGNGDGFVMHQMRTFMKTEPKFSSGLTSSVIFCKRENVTLGGLVSLLGRKGTAINLIEGRYSLALNMSKRSGQYAVTLLADLRYADDKIVDYALVQGRRERGFQNMKEAQARFKLVFHEKCPGVLTFQQELCAIILDWEDHWTKTLNSIDALILVKLDDILDERTRKGLMYDSPRLQMSEFYFEMLQIYRIFSESITQSVVELETLSAAFTADTGSWWTDTNFYWTGVGPTQKIVDWNWSRVLALHKSAAETLLRRMEKKNALVKSLQDGLFNAQSVREAIRGSQINRILLVFTVVTILYLPPTFVATIYGMHDFDGTTGIEATQDQFWKAFGIVTGLTYVIAFAVVALAWFKFSDFLPWGRSPQRPVLPGRKAKTNEGFGSDKKDAGEERGRGLFRRRKQPAKADEEKGKEK